MIEENRLRNAEIKAEPDPITIDLLRTAVIVVDMQNAFVKRGGYFDLAGYDLSGVQRIVEPCREVTVAAREAGARVVYLQMGFSQDLSDKGPDDSPVNAKSKGLRFINSHPDLKDKFYFYGRWGAEIIPELSPGLGDIVVPKQRYDAFIGTNLDIVLRTHRVRNLVFVGTATNVCVESTIRHAFFLDYFPILVSDAVVQAGSDVTQQATILNVKSHFGWVTTSGDFVKGVEPCRKDGRS